MDDVIVQEVREMREAFDQILVNRVDRSAKDSYTMGLYRVKLLIN